MLTPIPELGEGGLWRAAHLRRVGMSERHIRAAVERGRLERIRRGWYSLGPTHGEAERAVRAGGVLTCVSALRSRGVWTLTGPELHLRPLGRARPPHVSSLHWCHPIPRLAVASAVDDVVAALAVAVRCQPAEHVVVLLDSILRLGLLDRQGLMDARLRWPVSKRGLIGLCDLSDSGTETLVRLRLRALNIHARPQVAIPGVGRVDLVVGDLLVLEIDSREHHTGAEAYQRDRLRDRRLMSLGYLVMRLTYQDVVHHWDAVVADILNLVRARRHQAPRRVVGR